MNEKAPKATATGQHWPLVARKLVAYMMAVDKNKTPFESKEELLKAA